MLCPSAPPSCLNWRVRAHPSGSSSEAASPTLLHKAVCGAVTTICSHLADGNRPPPPRVHAHTSALLRAGGTAGWPSAPRPRAWRPRSGCVGELPEPGSERSCRPERGSLHTSALALEARSPPAAPGTRRERASDEAPPPARARSWCSAGSRDRGGTARPAAPHPGGPPHRCGARLCTPILPPAPGRTASYTVTPETRSRAGVHSQLDAT